MASMPTGLNERQRTMLAAFKNLPGSFRLNGRADAPIKWEVLDYYDGRTSNALFDRGLLRMKRIRGQYYFEVIGQHRRRANV